MKTRGSSRHQKAKPHKSPAPRISRKKLWVFRIITLIVIPVLLLGVLEIGLRLVGFGYPTSAIIQIEEDYPDIYHQNSKFGWRFFPKKITRELFPFAFDVHKTPQTYRIFILGASAAVGVPEPVYNFGRFLEVMLEDRYPRAKFEVITVAMPAINSHAILQAARDCAGYDPDLFIVYLGNNEVVGPFGPGSVFAPISPNLAAIRANLAIKSTQTGQLVEKLVQSFAPQGQASETWGGMEMFLDKQVRYNDSTLTNVYNYFEQNLNDIIKAGLNAGADVIVSNVACNLKDSPPFASLHQADLTGVQEQNWQRHYQAGIDFEADGLYRQAIEKYLVAATIDETFADLQFRLGRCYLNVEEYEVAKKRFVKAREYDTLRFRADTRINRIIQSVAEERSSEGVYFVDTVKAMEANSPHQIPGNELFYEHVHYTCQGNYLAAKNLFDTIEQLLPAAVKQQKSDSPILTLQQCRDRMVFTGYEEYYIVDTVIRDYITSPPFTNQLYHAGRVDELEKEREALKIYTEKSYVENIANAYHRQIQNHPNDWKLRYKLGILLRIGLDEPDLAVEEFKKILAVLPDGDSFSFIVEILESQGKIEDASYYHRRLMELRPGYQSVYLDKTQAVVNHYKQVLEEKPNFLPALNNLAWIESTSRSQKIRNPQEGLRYAQKACELTGFQDPQFLDTLAVAYAANGEFQQAAATAGKAVTIASQAGDTKLAQNIQGRLDLYQAGEMFFDEGLD